MTPHEKPAVATTSENNTPFTTPPRGPPLASGESGKSKLGNDEPDNEQPGNDCFDQPNTDDNFLANVSHFLQACCLRYLEFHSNIQVSGFINVNIDCQHKMDFVIKEDILKDNSCLASFSTHSYLAKKYLRQDQSNTFNASKRSPERQLFPDVLDDVPRNLHELDVKTLERNIDLYCADDKCVTSCPEIEDMEISQLQDQLLPGAISAFNSPFVSKLREDINKFVDEVSLLEIPQSQCSEIKVENSQVSEDGDKRKEISEVREDKNSKATDKKKDMKNTKNPKKISPDSFKNGKKGLTPHKVPLKERPSNINGEYFEKRSSLLNPRNRGGITSSPCYRGMSYTPRSRGRFRRAQSFCVSAVSAMPPPPPPTPRGGFRQGYRGLRSLTDFYPQDHYEDHYNQSYVDEGYNQEGQEGGYEDYYENQDQGGYEHFDHRKSHYEGYDQGYWGRSQDHGLQHYEGHTQGGFDDYRQGQAQGHFQPIQNAHRRRRLSGGSGDHLRYNDFGKENHYNFNYSDQW